MNILLIATREITGRLTGRKLVLRTIVRSCEALGHRVDVAVIGPATTAEARGRSIAGPGLGGVCLNVVRHFLLGSKSLNECLYWSRSAQRQIDEQVIGGAYDLVIADMVRTAQFCCRLPVPWVLDLDDLLSTRYAKLVEAGDASMPLGYFSQRLPSAWRPAATWLARKFLRAESRRVAAQELRFGRLADAVSLVSPLEARTLAARLGKFVHSSGMSIDAAPDLRGDHASRHRRIMLFVGGLDYQPNRDAIAHYLENIAPELVRLGCAMQLHVIGHAPVEMRPPDPLDRVVYLGYVDDLAATSGRYSIFVAPILAQGGRKTKVLEAMASGLAVIGTEQAVEGLAAKSDQECIVAATPEAFAEAIQRLACDAQACERLGAAAQGFVRGSFSSSKLQANWHGLLGYAVANFESTAAGNARVGRH